MCEMKETERVCVRVCELQNPLLPLFPGSHRGGESIPLGRENVCVGICKCTCICVWKRMKERESAAPPILSYNCMNENIKRHTSVYLYIDLSICWAICLLASFFTFLSLSFPPLIPPYRMFAHLLLTLPLPPLCCLTTLSLSNRKLKFLHSSIQTHKTGRE